MREIPILMNDEAVRAILAGKKTQTRRPVRPQPGPDGISDDVLPQEYGLAWRDAECREYRCPFGKPGGRLWVREAWQERPAGWAGAFKDGHMQPAYRADPRWSTLGDPPGKWRPSTHMPRWASRITLLVKCVWVERVQDISEEDAYAECVAPNLCMGTSKIPFTGGFAEMWDSIYAKRSLGWDDNPWVWACKFEPLQPGVSELESPGDPDTSGGAQGGP